ncbi:MAG TPA: DNA/pantothenate metabolism flavoprotein domain protein, partial [Clostridia bacterium]|nr:DNA/pantothenate metabolism flavoprotein domain protein [Clostridia bacterium]
ASLRDWFPRARIVGWKYEVDGDRASVIRLAQKQIADCRTNACVANGSAYGAGFGVVQANGACTHVPNITALFSELEKFLQKL